MRTIHFYVISSLILLVSCAKENNFGTKSLEVTVQLGGNDAPEGVKVYLKKVEETDVVDEEREEGYLTFALTDTLGKVTFHAMREGETYKIYAEHNSSGIPYYAEEIVVDGNEEKILSLVSGTHYGVEIECVDNAGDPVPGVNVCFFESQVLANVVACESSTFSGVTGSNGKLKIVGFDNQTYYYGIKDTIGGIPIYEQASFSFSSEGILPISVVVFP